MTNRSPRRGVVLAATCLFLLPAREVHGQAPPAEPSTASGAQVDTPGSAPSSEAGISGDAWVGLAGALVGAALGFGAAIAAVKLNNREAKRRHAEAVRIVFDPSKLSYAELLERWFFRMHDPTTKNRQGNDVGSQYRSAIFVTSPAQREVAEAVKRRVNESGKWPRPVVTEIVDAGPFTAAEEYHQDYLEKNPGGYTCHFLRD